MSTLETILSRAMSDNVFADLLFTQPEKALEGYDLTAEERAQLKELSLAKFNSSSTEERKSMVMLRAGLIQKFSGGDVEGEVSTLP